MGKRQCKHGYSGHRAGWQLVRDVICTVSPPLFGACESSGMKKLGFEPSFENMLEMFLGMIWNMEL